MKKKCFDPKAVSGHPNLLTVEMFAPIVSWHNESVRRAIRQGRLHAVKVGRNWRIPPETVEQVKKEGIPSR